MTWQKQDSRKKVRKDNPFVSASFCPFSFYSLFPGWASKEFRLAGEFRGDVLSARAGVFNIQDIREGRERGIGDGDTIDEKDESHEIRAFN